MDASLPHRQALAFDVSALIALDHMNLHGEAEASDESDTSWDRHCKNCLLDALHNQDTGEVVNEPIRRAAFL